MSWGHATEKPPPPPRSALKKLTPLIVLIFLVLFFAFVGYHIYLSVQAISSAASKKMEDKHVVVTKDGMKVQVKELKTERYVDNTQSVLVKAWNLSSWPGYKSRLWNKGDTPQADSRKPYSSG